MNRVGQVLALASVMALAGCSNFGSLGSRGPIGSRGGAPSDNATYGDNGTYGSNTSYGDSGSYGNNQLAGNSAVPGAGRIAPTAAGAGIGALVGTQIGGSLDQQDREQAFVAAQNSFKSGSTTQWSNQSTGHYGTVDPTPTYTSPTGQTCRSFSHTIWVDGRNESVKGQGCRQRDGSWLIGS